MIYLFYFVFWFTLSILENVHFLKVLGVISSMLNLSLFLSWVQEETTRKALAFWIWKNLSGEHEPFYENPSLKNFKAPTPPPAMSWFGLRLYLWIMASSYLIKVGELSYTPTLREKF